jgi:hypothetical protein
MALLHVVCQGLPVGGQSQVRESFDAGQVDLGEFEDKVIRVGAPAANDLLNDHFRDV